MRVGGDDIDPGRPQPAPVVSARPVGLRDSLEQRGTGQRRALSNADDALPGRAPGDSIAVTNISDVRIDSFLKDL
jgi:hypothetical protein